MRTNIETTGTNQTEHNCDRTLPSCKACPRAVTETLTAERERGGFGGGLVAGDGQGPGGADGNRLCGGADGGSSQGKAFTLNLSAFMAECPCGTWGPTDGGRTKVHGHLCRAERPTDQGDKSEGEAWWSQSGGGSR